jgi:hypothetical protein
MVTGALPRHYHTLAGSRRAPRGCYFENYLAQDLGRMTAMRTVYFGTVRFPSRTFMLEHT